MTRMLAVVFMMACTCAYCVRCTAFDKDSFEHRLSMTYSEIYCTNGSEVAFKMIDFPERFYLEKTGNLADRPRYARAGESFVLKCGDVLRIDNKNTQWVSEIVVTNKVEIRTPGVGQGDFGKSNGPFLMVRLFKHAYWHEKSVKNYRSAVIDPTSGRFYDQERMSFGDMKFPFQALWKDWRDYRENFDDTPQVDQVLRLRTFAHIDRNRLNREDSMLHRLFQKYCLTLTNSVPCVVLYQIKKTKEGSVSYLARVVVKDGSVKVLGTAQYRSSGINSPDIIDIFDEEGVLQWSCYFDKTGGGKYYKYGKSGEVLQFVELDGDGGELPPDKRILKNEIMVTPENRPSFMAVMQSSVRPLSEAWKNRNYVVAVELMAPLEKSDSKTKDRLREYSRKQREKIVEQNRERCANGLPDMTENEQRLFQRAEAWEGHRIWCERMRHETTGRKMTTAIDSMMDLERVRLQGVYWAVARGFPAAVGIPGTRPKALRDLIGIRDPEFGQLLLPGGDNDIRDQWGREYRFSFGLGKKLKTNSEHPIIESAGPDGLFDTEDDLSSEDWFLFQKIDAERRKATLK